MTEEELKTKFSHMMDEAYNKGNLDALNEFWIADVVYHQPPLPDFKGLEASKQFVASVRKAYSDLTFTIEELIVEGESGAMHWSMQGTHTAQSPSLPIPPTGKRVTLRGLAMFHTLNGKGVEMWNYTDMLGVMQQLGVAPPMGKAGE